MKTLNKLTTAEQAYDDAWTNFEGCQSEENEQALILAGKILQQERRQDKIQQKRVLDEVNKHLTQGRKPEKATLSNQLVVICLLLMGLVAFIAWLQR